jgi:hypothetical protein
MGWLSGSNGKRNDKGKGSGNYRGPSLRSRMTRGWVG